MKNNNFWLMAVLLIIVVAALAWLLRPDYSSPPTNQPIVVPSTIKAAAPTEKPRRLPQVITLYQKGEGESDLALFVAKELEKKFGQLATYRNVDTREDDQLAEYYGVSEMPAIIILNAAGKAVRIHEGYLAQEEILKTLKSL